MNFLITLVALLIIVKGLIKGLDNYFDVVLFFISLYIVIRQVIEILVFLIL